MTVRAKIAVVVLNYNSASYTLRCLKSLQQYTADRAGIAFILVDNHSLAADRQLLESLPRDAVTCVWSERNLGFAGGMMLGAHALPADYYLFLNNDCEFLNDVLAILAGFMDTHPQVALCGARMLDAEGQPRSSFGYFPSLQLALFGSGVLRLFRPRRYPSRRKTYRQPVEVSVVTGAAMFVRASALQALGGLDTGYFLYCEEEDFAWRIRQAGWQAYHVPEAEIRHTGGASSKAPGLQTALQREYYISLFRYLRKHHGPTYAFAYRVLVAVKLLRRALLGRVPYRLLQFVLRGAPASESLRYRQDWQASAPDQSQADNAD